MKRGELYEQSWEVWMLASLRAQAGFVCMCVFYKDLAPYLLFSPFSVLMPGIMIAPGLSGKLRGDRNHLICMFVMLYLLKFRTSTLSAGAKKLLSTLRTSVGPISLLGLGDLWTLGPSTAKKKKGITMISLLFALPGSLFRCPMTSPVLQACTPQV